MILSARYGRRAYCTIMLMLGSLSLVAQGKLTGIDFRINTGIGISNKPGQLFGVPFALSGELATMFNGRWRVTVEGGVLDFRDSKNPDGKFGLILPSYSRYSHQYVGLRAGCSVLKTSRLGKLFLSGGADYLLIVDPNIKKGSLGGGYFDYLYERYLNIPVQLDYSVLPFKKRQAKLVFIGRWNFNAYHSFPMVSLGIDLPIYPLPSRY